MSLFTAINETAKNIKYIKNKNQRLYIPRFQNNRTSGDAELVSYFLVINGKKYGDWKTLGVTKHFYTKPV